MKITDCCGASPRHDVDEEIGICPDCGEHCQWIDEPEPPKRFRASIYLDVYAADEDKALEIMRQICAHLGQPGEEDLPDGYCNPYTGGVARWINGDLIGNSKRCDKI